MRKLLIFLWLFCVVAGRAANPSFDDFNTNQFSKTGNKVAVKSGATFTNVVADKLTVNNDVLFVQTPAELQITGGHGTGRFMVSDSAGLLSFTPNLTLLLGANGTNLSVGGELLLNGRTNRLSISTTNTLLLDGVPIVTGDATTTNTVINSTTINVTTQIFNVAKGATLTVTNGLTPLQIGASKVVGTAADGSLTNLDGVFTTRGSILYRNATVWTALVPSTAGYVLTDGGVGADPAWAAAAGGGSGVATTVTTLAYSGATNIIGFDCATNGSAYKLTLTNNAYIGGANVTNLQASSVYMTYTLHVQNNSAGLFTLTFDPTIFAWSEGVQPVKKTNGLAGDVYYFHTHLFTNSMLVGSMNHNIK